MAHNWITLKDWPELILERLEDDGVARIVLNRPDKRGENYCHAVLSERGVYWAWALSSCKDALGPINRTSIWSPL